MRSLAALVLFLTACELQPAPRIQQKTAGSGAAAASVPPGPPLEPPPDMINDAGSAVPPSPMKRPFETTATCNDIGVKVADTLIAEARDLAQKQLLESERTRIVRRTAETCTRDKWPQPSVDCFLKAESAAAMQLCGKDLAAPAPEGNEKK